jgi:hypothetical protein
MMAAIARISATAQTVRWVVESMHTKSGTSTRLLLATIIVLAPALSHAKPLPSVRLTVDGELSAGNIPMDAALALKRLGPTTIREAVEASARLMPPGDPASVDYFVRVHLTGLDAEVIVSISAPPSNVHSRTVLRVLPAANATEQLAKMRQAFAPLIPMALRDFRASYIRSFALPEKEIRFAVQLPYGVPEEARRRWSECAVATWNFNNATPTQSSSSIVEYRLRWPIGIPSDRIVGSYVDPTLYPADCDASLKGFDAQINPIAGGVEIDLINREEDDGGFECATPTPEGRRRAKARREGLRVLFGS